MQKASFLFAALAFSLAVGCVSVFPEEDGAPATPTAVASPTPSTTSGPFAGLQLWKDGCGSELWGRWTNTQDFQLLGVELSTTAGDFVASVSYGDLTFAAGMEDAWRFFDGTPLPESSYRLRFEFGSQPDLEVTLPVDGPFYPGPTLFTPESVTTSEIDGLRVSVLPSINGTVQRILVYDGQWCPLSWTVFYSEPTLVSGSTEILEVGGFYPSATSLHLTFEGVDADLYYTYYSTVVISVP